MRRGPHSIGSHVRDAAAYVCWAFGRAYSSRDMKDTLEQLAPHLLTVACYDREVSIILYTLLHYENSLNLLMKSWHIFRDISYLFLVQLATLPDVGRLIVEEQPQLPFRRMLEDRETFHMALR